MVPASNGIEGSRNIESLLVGTLTMTRISKLDMMVNGTLHFSTCMRKDNARMTKSPLDEEGDGSVCSSTAVCNCQ